MFEIERCHKVFLEKYVISCSLEDSLKARRPNKTEVEEWVLEEFGQRQSWILQSQKNSITHVLEGNTDSNCLLFGDESRKPCDTEDREGQRMVPMRGQQWCISLLWWKEIATHGAAYNNTNLFPTIISAALAAQSCTKLNSRVGRAPSLLGKSENEFALEFIRTEK